MSDNMIPHKGSKPAPHTSLRTHITCTTIIIIIMVMIRSDQAVTDHSSTPQNTPLDKAPISSRAQQPGVSTINEEDAASIFAANPALVSMMQNKLSGLVGRSSGYVESLPAPVRRRVAGLKGVQKEHSKLEAEFQEEVLALEKKFFAKYAPLYEKRAKIISGLTEPTEQEVEAGKEDEEDDDEDEEDDEADKADESAADIKGIPEFWLSAMKNSSLAETITDRDEGALKFLTDIRMEYLERPGFRLIFEFAENEFFTNKTITKTYYYQEENGYGGDFIYDHAEGDKIDWQSGKDLTVRVESKKQRNKNTKQTRIVKKTIPTPSFFDFFNPASPPTEEDEDVEDDIEAKLELDYQLGEDIKEKLIPRAIDWFTGEALQFEQGFEDFDDEDEFEDEDDEDEEDYDRDEEDDEEESDEEGDGSKPKQETAECKQS
ncbi:nucleosome assembly protein-like protein [Aureobasidium subglaciale]|nr:nucleosome assembly protein-like protein [Aureobasidium subglaciale]